MRRILLKRSGEGLGGAGGSGIDPEMLDRISAVMDLTAILLCRDHAMPLVVFDMSADGALTKIVSGDKVGTRIEAG